MLLSVTQSAPFVGNLSNAHLSDIVAFCPASPPKLAAKTDEGTVEEKEDPAITREDEMVVLNHGAKI